MTWDPYTVDTSAGPLSGRMSRPDGRPRGLVFALHGGTYDSSYYGAAGAPLMTAAVDRGFGVVALDRPGYGASAAADPSYLSFEAQSRILAEALDAVVASVDPVGSAVLVGHSIGGMIALKVAASVGERVAGVEVSGVGGLWQPGMLEMWRSFIGGVPAIEVPAEPHAAVMFGPEGTYAEETRAADAMLIRPMPMPELEDVVRWAEEFPGVAAQVRVPVSVTFPEFDNIWRTDEEARDLSARFFTQTDDVVVQLLPGAGHCAELHKPAREYARAQVAFVERCLSSPS